MSEKYNILWKCLAFSELSLEKLYGLLALRSKVFVVEQQCHYQDMDGIDRKCYHLIGMNDDGRIVAYSRLIPPGVKFSEASIGRIVVDPEARAKGLGKELVLRSIETCADLFENAYLRIGAQVYLQNFYEALGFLRVSEIYDDDGIPHIEMQRKA